MIMTARTRGAMNDVAIKAGIRSGHKRDTARSVERARTRRPDLQPLGQEVHHLPGATSGSSRNFPIWRAVTNRKLKLSLL